jgi:transcriptional regulator with GAF, ATPase, and Fis domain
VNVRLIAATNRNLEEAIQAGRFRSDLFYRLNVFPLEVPALRERHSDIPKLAKFFLSIYSKKIGKNIEGISQNTMERVSTYSWPGNVRELQNVIERAVIITKGATLTVSVDELKPDARVKSSQSCESLREILSETERIQVLRALESSNGVVAGANGAAVRLGIKRSTLVSRMQKLGIRLSRAPVSENRALPSITAPSERRVLELPVRNPALVDVERKGQTAFA